MPIIRRDKEREWRPVNASSAKRVGMHPVALYPLHLRRGRTRKLRGSLSVAMLGFATVSIPLNRNRGQGARDKHLCTGQIVEHPCYIPLKQSAWANVPAMLPNSRYATRPDFAGFGPTSYRNLQHRLAGGRTTSSTFPAGSQILLPSSNQ